VVWVLVGEVNDENMCEIYCNVVLLLLAYCVEWSIYVLLCPGETIGVTVLVKCRVKVLVLMQSECMMMMILAVVCVYCEFVFSSHERDDDGFGL
jgi:hypothetical protein